jgi:tetratricopeptide (TPR) repeat protein
LALTYLGDADSQLNKPDLARPLFEKAIRINPSIELAHLDLGVLMSDAGRNDDALRELQVAARLAPNDTDVHWRLGRLYRKMGRMQEAKLEFNKAGSLHKIENDAVIQKMSPSSRPPSQNASHP